MNSLEQIDQPTLLVNEKITHRNILRMYQRALDKQTSFRPHFKTHQSAQVGEWFREVGLTKITVSSVEMAEYFADHGWQDILIAFSMNLRQIRRINTLAERVHLEVLVENSEAVRVLAEHVKTLISVWIKVDVGNQRTGLDWQDVKDIKDLSQKILQCQHLKLAGLLTHSGHTYHAADRADVVRIFREGVERLDGLRKELANYGIDDLKISVGDTPGCSLCEDWSGIDEVRPGNFVFYDVMQALAGVCAFDEVSVALACPVVAKHPTRREIVVYGGAIHLSKDSAALDGHLIYGLPALQSGDRWGPPISGAWVDRLSQEHGILHVPGHEFNEIAIGELVFILPVHSCLTVQVMGQYQTLQGERIMTLNKM